MVSPMDKECVLLLPQVCKVLLDSSSSLPDDTSLEKLLDWFTGLAEMGGSLLEVHPCLLEFISAVFHQTSSDPGVLSYALKLCGLIAANLGAFTVLQDRSILDVAFNCQHWKEAGLWDDPCIRMGWIQGLRMMLQHWKALGFLAQEDVMAALLQLQTDSSLFVASAANQLLAHVLLFFQPALSAGCNGAHEQHRDDIRTRASITDSTESSSDYAAVVTTITEHLKESLLTSVSGQQPCRAQQTLKLLALLLAQAGPALRDKLLGSVSDSLNELVTAGDGQLTHSLMDAIVAAQSTEECDPDPRVDDLMSSILSVNKPSDLVRSAAAFLRRAKRDAVHTSRAVRILLLPLAIVTSQPLLDMSTAEEAGLISMTEELKRKTSCVSIICICLTNAARVALTPLDALPCPPAVILAAVLSLLRICIGDVESSLAGSAQFFRNIVGCGKVQKCALEAVAGFSSCSGVKDKLTEVFPVLIRCLNNPHSDPTVLQKSFQAITKWLSACEDLSSVTVELRRDLADAVRKRVCDARWEVRDSTVEFVGKAAGVLKCADAAEALWDGCGSVHLLREALQDPESYVRASAVSGLAQTLAHGWQQGAALAQEQMDVVSRLLEILSQDTEGFSRRAALQYFISWFSSCASHTSPLSSSSSSSSSLLMTSVSSVLSLGSADLDWEVKVHTLELAELLLDEAFSGRLGYRKSSERTPTVQHPYAVVSDRTRTHSTEWDLADALEGLVKQGVVSAMLSGLVDCDRPVALKACQLLVTLRETVCRPRPDTPDATAVVGVTCELPGRGWGTEVRKILQTETCDEDKMTDEAAERLLSPADEKTGMEDDNVCVDVCELLKSLGLDARLDMLSQSSDHVHNSHLSLLQDILAACPARTHAGAQKGEEVIVDCY